MSQLQTWTMADIAHLADGIVANISHPHTCRCTNCRVGYAARVRIYAATGPSRAQVECHHPDRPVAAWGLCKPCYDHARYRGRLAALGLRRPQGAGAR